MNAARAATSGMNVESGAGPALPFKTPVLSRETGKMNAAGKRNQRIERLGGRRRVHAFKTTCSFRRQKEKLAE